MEAPAKVITKVTSPQGVFYTSARATYTGTRSKHFKAGQVYDITIQASDFCVGVWCTRMDYLGHQNTDDFFSNWKIDPDCFNGVRNGKGVQAGLMKIKSSR
jgi:hypothetical protein